MVDATKTVGSDVPPANTPAIVVNYYTTTEACSCPDFRYRGRLRPCKHIRRLRDAHALIEATNRKWDGLNVDDRQPVAPGNVSPETFSQPFRSWQDAAHAR